MPLSIIGIDCFISIQLLNMVYHKNSLRAGGLHEPNQPPVHQEG
jgi:hypothetical protein